jgi:hypothetical protein
MKFDFTPTDIVSKHGAMTTIQCLEYFPGSTKKLIDAKLRQAFRVGKLKRRIDESCSSNRASYIYYDSSGQAGSAEPEHCVILRTLGKPLEQTSEIY